MAGFRERVAEGGPELVATRIKAAKLRIGRVWVPCIEADLPYHGGLLGAHMHDPYATRPGEVGTMIGEWLGAPLSTPTHQVHLCGRTDAEADFVPGAKGHGL